MRVGGALFSSAWLPKNIRTASVGWIIRRGQARLADTSSQPMGQKAAVPSSPTADAAKEATESAPQRHILPKNLRHAIKRPRVDLGRTADDGISVVTLGGKADSEKPFLLRVQTRHAWPVKVKAQLDQAHFMMICSVGTHRQRQAVAIHYRHDFHAFSTLGRTDLRTPALGVGLSRSHQPMVVIRLKGVQEGHQVLFILVRQPNVET